MVQRVAFLIGNQTFRPESGLLPLQGPANDVAALARLLRDPEHGNFEVREFLDKAHHEVLPELERSLGSAALGDLFLIYYSGHGKLARNNHLCLATEDTREDVLRSTSIPTRDLRDLVEQSECDQVLLLLDCCYSGAVDVRGDVSSELQIVDNARGFYIITASTSVQPARETALLESGMVMGRFTAALVDGIETGAADQDRKGRILLSDLRRHLDRVPIGSTPQFFASRANGDPLISLSPATALPLLDVEILADLDDELWHRRQGAVLALSKVIRDGNAATRAAAKAALQRRLGQERDYAVRTLLQSTLGPDATHPAATPMELSPTELAQHRRAAEDAGAAINAALASLNLDESGPSYSRIRELCRKIKNLL